MKITKFGYILEITNQYIIFCHTHEYDDTKNEMYNAIYYAIENNRTWGWGFTKKYFRK